MAARTRTDEEMLGSKKKIDPDAPKRTRSDSEMLGTVAPQAEAPAKPKAQIDVAAGKGDVGGAVSGAIDSLLATKAPGADQGVIESGARALGGAIQDTAKNIVRGMQIITPPVVPFNPAAPYGTAGIAAPPISATAPPQMVDISGEKKKAVQIAIEFLDANKEAYYPVDEGAGPLQKLANDTLSIIPSIGAAAAGFAVAGPIGAGVMGGGLEAAAQYGDALESGATEGEALRQAAIVGTGTGILNAIPFMNLFGRFLPKSKVGSAAHWLISGALEGATETAEGGLGPIAEADIPKSLPELQDLTWRAINGVWEERSVFLPAMITGILGVGPVKTHKMRILKDIDRELRATTKLADELESIIPSVTTPGEVVPIEAIGKTDSAQSIGVTAEDAQNPTTNDLGASKSRLEEIINDPNTPVAVVADARDKLAEVDAALDTQAQVAAKQPWEMTLEEFVAARPSVDGYLYHGSPTGDIEEVDPSRSKLNANGPGFYATDTRDKALGYSAGATASGDTLVGAPNTGKVNYVKSNAKNIIDMDAPADMSLWKRFYADQDIPSEAFNTRDGQTNADVYKEALYFMNTRSGAVNSTESTQSWMRQSGIDASTHTEGTQSGEKHKVTVFYSDKAEVVPAEKVYEEVKRRATKSPVKIFYRGVGRAEKESGKLRPGAWFASSRGAAEYFGGQAEIQIFTGEPRDFTRHENAVGPEGNDASEPSFQIWDIENLKRISESDLQSLLQSDSTLTTPTESPAAQKTLSEQQSSQQTPPQTTPIPLESTPSETTRNTAPDAEPITIDGINIKDPNAYMTLDNERGGVRVTGLVNAAKKKAKTAGAWLSRNFTSQMDLPIEVYEAELKRVRELRRDVVKTTYSASQYNKAIKKTKATDAEIKQANEYLNGRAQLSTVKQGLQKSLEQMRKDIDNYTVEAIRRGVVTGDLAKTFDKNKGLWLHRNYRALKDTGFTKKFADANPVFMNQLKTMIQSEMYPQQSVFTPEEQGYVQGKIDLLMAGPGGANVTEFLRGTRMGQKELGAVMHRNDPTDPQRAATWEAIRKLWGEETDIVANYAESMLAMSQLVVNHTFLDEVAKAGEGKFLFKKEFTDASGTTYITQIAPPKGMKIVTREWEIDPTDPTKNRKLSKEEQFMALTPDKFMSPIGHFFTTPELAAAFKGAYEPTQYGPIMHALMRVSSGIKIGKTVFAPYTHSRNFLSNALFAVQQGHWRVDKFGTTANLVGREFLGLTGDKQAQINEALTLLGVRNDSAHLGELRAMANDVIASNWDVPFGGSSRPRKVVRGVVNKVQQAYGLEDDFWKIYAFYNEYARYSKAYKGSGMTDAEIRKMAAEVVTNTYPTYSKAVRAVKTLSRAPIIGNFPTFPSEVIRTTFNTLKLATRELKDKRTMLIGMQRLLGMGAAHSLMATAGFGISKLMQTLGRTADDHLKEDFREFMAPWDQNANISILKTGNGTVQYINTSAVDPMAYFKAPIMAAMRGEEWESKVAGSVYEGLRPFLSLDIAADTFFSMLYNRRGVDPTDLEGAPPISRDTRTGYNMLARAMWGIDQTLPGFIDQFKNIALGAESTYRQSQGKSALGTDFRQYNLGEELVALGGLRIQTLDVRKQFPIKAADLKRSLTAASSPMFKVAYKVGPLEKGEVDKARASTEEQRRAIFAEAQKICDAARRTGITDKELTSMLRESQWSIDDAKYLTRNGGRYKPYKLNDEAQKRLKARSMLEQ